MQKRFSFCSPFPEFPTRWIFPVCQKRFVMHSFSQFISKSFSFFNIPLFYQEKRQFLRLRLLRYLVFLVKITDFLFKYNIVEYS